MHDYYDVEKRCKNNGFLTEMIGRIVKISDLFPLDMPLTDMSLDRLCTIVAASERISLMVRACIEEKRDLLPEWDKDEIGICENIMDTLPCSASFNEEAFIVKTPLTIKRGDSKSANVKKENYLLVSYVTAAIRYWQEQNPGKSLYLNEEFTKGDLVCIMKRKAVKFNKNVHCDNDNIENGKILNVMCSALGCSDSCRVMDLVSCFREVQNPEDKGTEFIITKRENLAKYLDG